LNQTSALDVYQILINAYSPQHWWPAQCPFEMMVGAIFTQNINWKNAGKTICNLK